MRANRLPAGLLGALLVLSGTWLLGTSPGSAAVVSFEETGTLHSDPTGEGCSRYGMCDQRSSTAKLEAAAGEQNTVSVEASGGGLLFRDVTPLLAGSGCEPAAGGAVRCPRPKGTVTVLLGDGDDVAITAVQAHVDGGPGTDEIALLGGGTVAAGDGDDLAWGGNAPVGLDGQGGDDVLLGGDEDDRLTGGAGADKVTGGAGADQLVDEPLATDPVADADAYDGGEGEDEVSYLGATAPVHVDLARDEGQGQAGENDVLARIESASGGRGSDVLAGTDGSNRLFGGSGRADRIAGRGGDDELRAAAVIDGGAGNDKIESAGVARGGAGADRISSARSAAGGDGHDVLVADRASCGPGSDVAYPDQTVTDDCERVSIRGEGDGDTWLAPAAGARHRGSVLATVRDPCDVVRRRCRGRVEVRAADGALLAAGHARAPHGRRMVVRARLTRRGAAYRARGAMNVRVRYTYADGAGGRRRGAFGLRLTWTHGVAVTRRAGAPGTPHRPGSRSAGPHRWR